MNRDKGQGSLSSNAYVLTPAGIHFTGRADIFWNSREPRATDENVERKCFICTRSHLLFSRGPGFRRTLTIFQWEVQIAVCGCVPHNREADFDIAIRLFGLGARLAAQYERDCMRMVGCRRTGAGRVVLVKTKT
jgi:hypothetical protein